MMTEEEAARLEREREIAKRMAEEAAALEKERLRQRTLQAHPHP